MGFCNEIVCCYVHFLKFALLTLSKNLHKGTEKTKLLLLLLLLLTKIIIIIIIIIIIVLTMMMMKIVIRRVSMVLTDRRKTAKNLVDSRKY